MNVSTLFFNLVMASTFIMFSSACYFSQWNGFSKQAHSIRSLDSQQFHVTHFTTPARYGYFWVMYCFSMLAIYLLLWLTLDNYLQSLSLQLFLVWGVAVGLVLLPYVPRFGVPLNRLCYYMQRHCFMPVLPSPSQDRILSQLMSNSNTFQPSKRQLAVTLPASLRSALDTQSCLLFYEKIKAEFLYQRIELAAQHHVFKKGRPELDQQLAVLKAMRNNMHIFSPVDSKRNTEEEAIAARTLQRMCFELITYLILMNYSSREQRRRLFQFFGLAVIVHDFIFYRVMQQTFIYAVNKLPNGRSKAFISEKFYLSRAG